MSGAGGERMVRLNNDRGGVRSHHGPVKREGRAGHLEVTAFTGSEESDVLHAAADWIKDRPFALIVAMNWRSDAFSR